MDPLDVLTDADWELEEPEAYDWEPPSDTEEGEPAGRWAISAPIS